MASPTQVDKLLYAWRLLQQRVNTDIPSRVNRIKAAYSRLRNLNPPRPPGL